MAERRSRSEEREEVNRNVRMAVRRFDVPGLGNESWDFLCECGAEDCKEWVTLSLEKYEALRQADAPILADGHHISRSEHARRKAKELADDGRALRAPADAQNKRASRKRSDVE